MSDFVAAAVAMMERTPRGLVCLDPSVRAHPRVLQSACARDPEMIVHVPPALLADVVKSLCVGKLPKALKCARACDTLRPLCDALTPWIVDKHPLALQHASDACKDDATLAYAALGVTPRVLEHVSERLRDCDDFVLAAVGRGGRLHHASARLRADCGFAVKVLHVTCDATEAYAALKMSLRKDRALLDVAMKKHKELGRGWTTSPFEYTSLLLKRQRAAVLDALPYACRNVYMCLLHSTPALGTDYDVVVAALRHGLPSEYVPASVFDDPDMARRVLMATGRGLRRAPAALRADRALVLQIVRVNGEALAYASDALRCDRAVVMAAIASTWKALKYVLSYEGQSALRADKDVVHAAVVQNGNALSYAHYKWRHNRPMVTLAAKTAPNAVRTLAPHFSEMATVRAAKLHNLGSFDKPSVRTRVLKELGEIACLAMSIADAQECSDLVAELAAKLPATWDDVLAAAEAFVARVHAPGGAVAHAHKRAYEEAFG